jgi:large subunit ribosomal protein L3
MTEGIIGKKLGMTQVFREGGLSEPVTAIQAGPCTVMQVKTLEKDGYQAVQLGYGAARQRARKRAKGKEKEAPKPRYRREFPLAEGEEMEPGQTVDVTLFQPGDKIDVTGTSRGKGFAGGVKRWNFRGGPKTHGQSDRHRAPGSLGAGTSPGRVFKGQHMAGHLGAERVTALNLEVVEVDADRNLLLVKGSVPGMTNGLVLVKKSTRGRQ